MSVDIQEIKVIEKIIFVESKEWKCSKSFLYLTEGRYKIHALIESWNVAASVI